MWELIWFLLGVLTYKSLSALLGISQKAKFIEEIRLSAFILIGSAFEELLKVHALKYGFLKNDPAVSPEQIKVLKNEDEAFLSQWKEKTIHNLNNSAPPLCGDSIKLKDWDGLISILSDVRDVTIKQVEETYDGKK
tara:strand:+ start:309 stop:716 length:408 start_codon:yes stop_codon:yes gene_type:complete